MGNSIIFNYQWLRDDSIKLNTYKVEEFELPIDIQTIKAVDLRKYAPDVYNQINPLLCVSNTVSSVYEYLTKKKNIHNPIKPSRLFMYYNEKDITGDPIFDITTSILDNIMAISKYGICSEDNWPYDLEKTKLTPIKSCYDEGNKNKNIKFTRLNKEEFQLKSCLVSGFPFIFGMNLYSNQNLANIQKDGFLKIPCIGDKICGGYVSACFGYSDYKNAYLCRGSFSNMWGDDGYFWIPYEYMHNDDTGCFWKMDLVV